MAAIGCLLMPDYTGLAQRLMYLGIYVWMHIVVREIERVRGVAKETECEAAKSVEQRPFGLDTLTHSRRESVMGHKKDLNQTENIR